MYEGINKITSLSLSSRDSEKLLLSLHKDAADLLYSAAVSFGDALHGISRGLFTWATVKLYYSVFYALRARLALSGICLFYIGSKPYSICVQTGEAAHKEEGQTHKIVIKLFQRHTLDSVLLSQQIGIEEPLAWLMRLREEANYKISRFLEPKVPDHFEWLSKVGIRQACETYLADKTYMYVFDPDHAVLAYPLRLLERSCSEFQSRNIPVLNEEEKSFIYDLFSDKKGTVSHLLKRIVC
jgi:uncharacterized protein (UPF0332 family)